MKKRVVAVLLSLTLCMATVLETGAAVFDSQAAGDGTVTEAMEEGGNGDIGEVLPPDGQEPVQPGDQTDGTDTVPGDVTPTPDITGTPDEPGDGDQGTDGQDPDVDVFVPEDPAIPEDPNAPQDGLTDAADEVDLFTSGEDELLTALPTVKQAVNETDWEETAAGSGSFMLHKTTTTYYTSADGIMYIETKKDKNSTAETGHVGYYLFDEAGVMVTGQKIMKPGTPGYTPAAEEEFYFTQAGVASLWPEYQTGSTSNAYTPVTSDLGQLKTNYWLWDGTSFRFYSADGEYWTMADYRAYRESKGNYTGYYNINGKYYTMEENGVPRTGDVELTEGVKPGKYYFKETLNDEGIPGEMFRSAWRIKETSKGDQWIYYKKDGRVYERGIVATRLDTEVMGDYTYLLSDDGYILKNTMQKAENGATYGTDKYGRVNKDKLVKYNGARYYFDGYGKLVTWKNCWHRCKGAGNRFYYFGSTPGKVVEKTGWQKVTSTTGKMYGWFFFSGYGNHYIDVWAKGGYFKPNGQLASGVTEVDGKTYFFQVSNSTTHRGKTFKNTWIHYRDKWYYAPSNGVLYKSGWKKIDSAYYYFQGDFTTKTNAFVSKSGVNGYVDGKGKFCTGWVIVSNANNQVRYINPDGSGFVKNTSKVIDGLRYYFDKNGYRKNDLTSVYRGPYYVEVDRVNCVMTIYDSSRTVPVKTIRVSVGLPGTPTPTSYGGTYVLSRSLRWQPLMGPSWGQYGTHVDGAGQGGIFVHSVAGWAPNSYSLPAAEYNRLGNPASHGCIRANVADAKWVYDNCNGARIKIFDGSYKADEALKGPLGRKARVALVGSKNYDPTDPLV